VSDRRVLWFINKVPLTVARTVDMPSVRGGWLDSFIEIVGSEPGIDLTVAFADPTGLVRASRIDGVSFVALPTGAPGSGLPGVIERWRHDVAPPAMLAAAAELIRDVAPDLIHLHGAELCFGLAARDCGIPTVLSVQGSPTVVRQLYLRGVDRHLLRSLSAEDFLKGRGLVHQHLKMKPQAANEAVIMASVGHIAGRTDWDRRLASVMAPQAVYHRCDEPMRPPFHQVSWRPETAMPGRILNTSGHYAMKGTGTLLRAIDIARRTAPGISLVLAGVYLGSEHEHAVVRHARALGIEDRLTIMGEIDAETLAVELTRANVFVNSAHYENSSNALAEAQLVGVPCVASAAGGTVTMADGGSAALLFQDGDARALAGAVLSLMSDPDEAARLGERGRALATARHDTARIREQIMTMYDRMLGRPSGADEGD
jgi:glycosyltransferase involved in cell wall biosynthesis